MASKSAFRVAPSATSTWLLKSGPGTVYGYTVGTPAAGGTVVVTDLIDVGANPNLGVPSTIGPGLISFAGPFAASLGPVSIPTHGQVFSTGLSLSLTSTVGVVVHYD